MRERDARAGHSPPNGWAKVLMGSAASATQIAYVAVTDQRPLARTKRAEQREPTDTIRPVTVPPRGPERGHTFAALLVGILMLALVALLDYLTPPTVSFGLIYMLAVLLVAWFSGARAGIAVAFLATLLEGANARLVLQGPWPVDVWNALSTLIVLSALAVIVDRLRRRELDLRRVDGDRRTLLRVLEREFPRPLRALDWFSRMLDENLEHGTAEAARKHIQSLRHHVQEADFLATDLLSVGSLQSGTLTFDRIPVDLRRIVAEAADATLEHGRIITSLPHRPVVVQCDPDRLRHAIASVFGRCIQTPHATVPVFVSTVGDEGLVQISAWDEIPKDDLELAQLLVVGGAGRLTVAPRNGSRGVMVTIFVPRAETAVTETATPAARPLAGSG